MTARSTQPLLRLVRFESETRTSVEGRAAASLILGLLAAGALVPLFALAAPSSSWDPATLVVTLLAIALFSYLGGVAVGRSMLLDAGFITALVAVAFLGPLPAFCIWAATEVAALAFERIRPTAFVANVASYGWAALAGGLVMSAIAGVPVETTGPTACLAVVSAGVAMLAANFFVTRTLVAVVNDGRRLGEILRRELIAHSPVTLAMVVVATAATFLYGEIGVLALGLFAAGVVVPQAVLPKLLAPKPVAELDHTDAVRTYACAIADAMRLPHKEKLVLKDAAAFMRSRPMKPRRGELSDLSDRHLAGVVEAVIYSGEHWDGCGGVPGAVGGEMIPLTSRVLAVADAWSGLTSKKGPQLSHSQAMNQLEARAGMHFDPAVVKAAARVVEDELGVEVEVAFQPQLHKLPFPRFARKLRDVSAGVGVHA